MLVFPRTVEIEARPDTPSPSIGQRAGRLSTHDTSQRRHDRVRRAPEPIRSGRADAGRGTGGAGTLPRVREGEVREDLPDDGGIVQGGDQAQPAPTMGTRQNINGKRPVTSAGTGVPAFCRPDLPTATWPCRSS